jgi:tRNA U38,U39,U40 pseudouridine synthase TruA
MRIAIGIEYAGNAFECRQTQPHGRTVQDFL